MDKEPDTPKLSRFERFTRALLAVPAEELAKKKEAYEQKRKRQPKPRQPS